MTLPRTVAVLSGVLVVALAVVVLRAERTRVQYEMSQIDRRAEELLLRLRAQELELARLRNPALIRTRATEMRLGPPPTASSGLDGSVRAP